jgi:hypothetical protein
MSQIEATVSWWTRKGKPAQVSSVAELDHIIDGVIESECKEHPTVVAIERLGYLFTMACQLNIVKRLDHQLRPARALWLKVDWRSLPYEHTWTSKNCA